MIKTLKSARAKPVIVFDFDGTIADTFALALDVLCELTRREPMPREDTSRLRGMTARELMAELHIRAWQLPLLGWRTRWLLARRLAVIEPIPGIEAAIQRLSRQYHLFILTSNTAGNVRSVLTRLGIASQFVGIYGDAGVLHKERSLRRLLRQNQLAAHDVWYVGDEVRDIEAAHHVGMPIAAVSWGFNNIGSLERCRPEALVFTPEELVTHFAKTHHGKGHDETSR